MRHHSYSIQSNGTLLYDIDTMSYGFRINEISLFNVSCENHVKLSTHDMTNHNILQHLTINSLNDILYNQWFFIDFFYTGEYFIYDNTYINSYLITNINSTIVNIFYNL